MRRRLWPVQGADALLQSAGCSCKQTSLRRRCRHAGSTERLSQNARLGATSPPARQTGNASGRRPQPCCSQLAPFPHRRQAGRSQNKQVAQRAQRRKAPLAPSPLAAQGSECTPWCQMLDRGKPHLRTHISRWFERPWGAAQGPAPRTTPWNGFCRWCTAQSIERSRRMPCRRLLHCPLQDGRASFATLSSTQSCHRTMPLSKCTFHVGSGSSVAAPELHWLRSGTRLQESMHGSGSVLWRLADPLLLHCLWSMS
mmetsp:Transcript_38942/g.82958  ORF Transcript_38942/g.82958 Transcript_38942/m.82958 type:complete len:255 (-) Transcript_38942:1441-2205(-)